MRRFYSLFLTLGVIVAFTACGNKQDGENSTVNNTDSQTIASSDGTAVSIPDSSQTENNQAESEEKKI